MTEFGKQNLTEFGDENESSYCYVLLGPNVINLLFLSLLETAVDTMPGAEDYAREVTQRAVASACVALDFKESYTNVVDSLADVVRNYIEMLGELTRKRAELGGRANPGVLDVFEAIMETPPENTTWRALRDFAYLSLKKEWLFKSN